MLSSSLRCCWTQTLSNNNDLYQKDRSIRDREDAQNDEKGTPKGYEYIWIYKADEIGPITEKTDRRKSCTVQIRSRKLQSDHLLRAYLEHTICFTLKRDPSRVLNVSSFLKYVLILPSHMFKSEGSSDSDICQNKKTVDPLSEYLRFFEKFVNSWRSSFMLFPRSHLFL